MLAEIDLLFEQSDMRGNRFPSLAPRRTLRKAYSIKPSLKFRYSIELFCRNVNLGVNPSQL
jgi:hypothetical protein